MSRNLISKVWTPVCNVEIIRRTASILEAIPIPFSILANRSPSRNRVHAPVNKYTKLGVCIRGFFWLAKKEIQKGIKNISFRQWARIKRFPVWLIHHGVWCNNRASGKNEHEQLPHAARLCFF